MLDQGNAILSKTDTSGTLLEQFPLPGSSHRDITWDGSSLWIISDGDDMVYEISPLDGSALSSFSTPSTNPSGVVFVSGSLFIADSGTNTLTHVTLTGAILSSVILPGSAPGALAYDGAYVWNNDTDEKMIYAFDVFELDQEE